MNIGEIGNFFSNTVKIGYDSDRSILEFDAIIVNFDYVTDNAIRKNPTLFFKRKENFQEFIQHKKMPIIYFVPTEKKIHVNIGNVPGGKAVGFEFFAPLPQLEIQNESGSQINILPNTPFTNLFKKYKEHLLYKSYIKSNMGNLVIETLYGHKALSIYNNEYVFIPFINGSIISVENDFLADLINCINSYIKPSELSQLPEWVSKFSLPNESILKEKINNITKEINNLNIRLHEDQNELLKFTEKKYLITGTGKDLEKIVEKIFIELGFEILKAEEGRDDLILKYKDQIAVVEIKGVTKSAAEKHTAQLEKWAANYFENNGIKPKGILVVNTYKDLPVDQRIDASFPDQMLKYSIQREHCLINTIQLLGIYYKYLNDPTLKESLINSLFNTTGIYNSFEDWSEFITKDI